MLKHLKQIGTKGKMASILVLLVMLPAIFYSAYEFSTLSANEKLVGDVYRRQLDVVLFSLNQYSWDVANSWANRINDALLSNAIFRKDLASTFVPFVNANSGIRCLFLSKNLNVALQIYYPAGRSESGPRVTVADITGSLERQSDVVYRLFRLQESGYRKIDPIFIDDKSGQRSLALIFATGGEGTNRPVIGVVIDAERFVRDILARKMDEAAGNDFLLSVIQKDANRIVYATGELQPGEPLQTKDLWLLPDYSIGIRLKGQTIDDVVRARFYQNLALIGLLTTVLVAGVWVVYRTVRREIELAQLKSDFVSNVSHEIKTPLALIRMFAETLQMKRVKSEQRKQEYYDTIVQETERLTRLINNILNFSRMEAGKKEYRFEPVDLNQLVQGVLKNYGAHLEHEGFLVSAQANGRLPRIHADSGAVSEALLNIIDNSVKYSRERKTLRLATGVVDSMVYVDVEDQGIGIPPEQQRKIFEKFYRVSSGLVRDAKGTGLGLALVKHIVDAHKGSISVRSEVDKGSTFRLSFPIDAGQSEQQESR